MSGTLLRLEPGGRVRLLKRHAHRLGDGALEPLRRFSTSAAPGVYRATWEHERLSTEARPGSRLFDGIPVRLVVSPFADGRGRFPKPGPGSAYEGVRLPNVASLLTDPARTELFEACVAALVAWDGSTLVLPPLEAPGVDSLAERALASALEHRRAPIPAEGDWPLLLVNAVIGTCAPTTTRAPFPADVRRAIEAVLEREDA